MEGDRGELMANPTENPFELSDEEIMQKALQIKPIIKPLTYEEAMKVLGIVLTLTFGISKPKEGK